MVKVKISVTIDKDVLAAFKGYCQANGMKVSTKVEQLMKVSVKDSTLQPFIHPTHKRM